ncbi:hypothetical protein ACN38_g10573 [Penicillium nordicum]|uniref:Uncharacterized protein n=1 Tax=Penicillium nordicum TaxID=229535 RepID=A0A0M8P080_9EURO|nr:hypothetical protein ACN38_g10573 [Penicillium nordicum]
MHFSLVSLVFKLPSERHMKLYRSLLLISLQELQIQVRMNERQTNILGKLPRAYRFKYIRGANYRVSINY